MFAVLGELKFEMLLSPVSFSDRREYSFAEHPVVSGRPVVQKIGEACRERSVTFRFHKAFCDPDESIKNLHSLAEEQEPQMFVLGTGTFGGEYVIAEVESVVEMLDRSGAPVWIDASVRLKEVPPQQVVTTMRKVRKKPQPQPGKKTKSVPKTSRVQYDYKGNALILAKKGDFSGMRW